MLSLFQGQIQLSTMLRFIGTTQGQRPAIRRTPHFTFGMSADSPPQFQPKHIVLSPYTLKKSQIAFESSFVRKVDLSRIEENRVVGKQVEPSRSNSRYLDSYYHELGRNASRFRLIRGEFSSSFEATRTGRTEKRPPIRHMIKDSSKFTYNTSQWETIRYDFIDTKRSIRKERLSLKETFQTTLETRKTGRKTSFALPVIMGKPSKTIEEHDLYQY